MRVCGCVVMCTPVGKEMRMEMLALQEQKLRIQSVAKER